MKRLLVVFLSVLALLTSTIDASANVCSANTNGKTAVCGESAGKCFYQSTWEFPTNGPLASTQANSNCCYDPGVQDCGAGAVIPGDNFVTPLVSPKRQTQSTPLGTDLIQCGLRTIVDRPDNICDVSTSCSRRGYQFICPFSKACTNDMSLCPISNSTTCTGARSQSCGGDCYDDSSHFCFDHEIYNKDEKFKCGGGLYEVRENQKCCGNSTQGTVYNPIRKACSNGKVHSLNERVCGRNTFNTKTQGCCDRSRIFDLATKDCSNNKVVNKGNEWSSKCRKEYNPSTHTCLKGKRPFPSYGLCNLGEKYALKKCYTPNSAQMGGSCASNDQCAAGKCAGIEGLTRGKCVCQKDNDCGLNAICKRGPLGIGKNKCVSTVSPTCPSGWTYQNRKPLKKDRCNRTTTQTASLKCKLGATNKAKNWTGPHAQPGKDECRSKKGNNPKGVKCPSGYTHNINPGADSCTKSKTDHQTPTCPAGWDYKSKKGKDTCLNK